MTTELEKQFFDDEASEVLEEEFTIAVDNFQPGMDAFEKTINIRELVLGILTEVLEQDNYSNVVIHNTLMKYQYLEKQDRAFLSRLAEGCVERCIQLDYIIDSFSKVKVKKMKAPIRNILRMGVYQILYMDSVPESAAVNESVMLMDYAGAEKAKGFVNAILRSFIRDGKKIDISELA